MEFDVKGAVQEKYGAVARTAENQGDGARKIAQAFGYTADDLAMIPEASNMGLSCGNPTAMASLRPGEVVLDLGSGGGLDVFLAALKVGPTGRAIGIDMTQDMIDLARRNAEKVRLANVEFHLAEIENLPLASGAVDCVISNCVLNLVPDKSRAFAEIFRVLKPGGRLAASDIALKKALPDELAGDLYAYVGCVAGAILISEYEQLLRAAGFETVTILDSGSDLNAYAQSDGRAACCPPPTVDIGGPHVSVGAACCAISDDDDLHHRMTELLSRYDVNAFAASVKVFAVKST